MNRKEGSVPMFLLQARKNSLTVRSWELLSSGAVNENHVQFQFSEDWNGLSRTAVFSAGEVSRSVLLAEDTMCAIPWEVLVEPRLRLYVGVYGVGDGGETVLPTVWADLGEIYPGAVPDQDAQPPTPDLWQQILAKASDHRFLSRRDAEEQHPINAISGLAKQLRRIPAPAEAITNAELEELLK